MDIEDWVTERNVALSKHTDATATYFGLGDYQASYELSLYYKEEFVASQTITEPFSLYFKELQFKDDGEYS